MMQYTNDGYGLPSYFKGHILITQATTKLQVQVGKLQLLSNSLTFYVHVDVHWLY